LSCGSTQHASLLVALRVTLLRHVADASNRECVIGGNRGERLSSYEAVRNRAADGGQGSPSSPRIDGKAIKKRAGRPARGEAGAPETSTCRKDTPARLPGYFRALRRVAAAILVVFSMNIGMEDGGMGSIYISAAVEVDGVDQHASLLVALRVTLLQNVADASNRECVIGGNRGERLSSYEAVRNRAADGAYGRGSWGFSRPRFS